METARDHYETELDPRITSCVMNFEGERFLTLFDRNGVLFYKEGEGPVCILTDKNYWMREGMSLLNRNGRWILHTMTDADVDVFPALITTDDKDAADKLLYPPEAVKPAPVDRMPAFVAFMWVGTCASGFVIGSMKLLTLWSDFNPASMNSVLSALSHPSRWHY